MITRGSRLVVLIALMVVFLDQLTKQLIKSQLELGEVRPIIGDLLKFHLIHNPGAAFSFLTGATWVFTLIATVFSTWIVVNSHQVTSTPWMIGVGGILGGAVGNLIDRLTNVPGFGVGHVIDFIEIPYWPVFNIADSAIFLSAIALTVYAYKGISMDHLLKGQNNHKNNNHKNNNHTKAKHGE